MRQRVLIAMIPAAALVCVLCPRLDALINPNFTPVHLVQQSKLILELHFDSVKAGKAVASVKQVVKGKTDAKILTIDLTASPYKEQAKLVETMVQAPGIGSALLFVGEFQQDGKGADAGAQEAGDGGQNAFLHMGAIWLTLFGGKGDTWTMEGINQSMAGTWAGGTDMLLRAVNYVLKDPVADIPTSTGANWADQKKFGDFPGKVFSARPVDLAGDGKLCLFVACEKADRLFAWDGKSRSFQDVTEKHALRSTSFAFAWGDMSGDGRLDLASWDGKNLTIRLQGADGTFTTSISTELTDCIALGALDVGTPGMPGLLISTREVPMLVTPHAATPRKIADGEWPGKNLGDAGKCLVADFDGDGIPDVIQTLAKGSLFYKGVKPGAFSPPVPCAIELGVGRSNAWLGDYDGDGLLDVFNVAEDALRLWHNLGKAQFVEALSSSGEVAYIGQPGGIDGMTGDFNNDGRQDVVIVYSAAAPQLFFNRGFRSFGKALTLVIGGEDMLPQAGKGAQTGCLADFNGDGAQDLALVLNGGEGWVLLRDPGGAGGLCVRATLPVKGPYAGPLTVTGWNDTRCLGAWNVVAGTDEAFFGQTEAGPCTFSWQFPGGKPHRKEIVLENKPVRFVLEP